MGKKYDFNYIIIGGGPAGSSVAYSLATSKKYHICLIEADTFGGSNLCKRDMPYLIGQSFAHDFYHLSQSPEMSSQTLHYNFPTIASHQLAVTNLLSNNGLQQIRDLGVTYVNGYAHFLDNHTVAVNNQEYTSDKFIVATGAKLATDNIIGLDSIKYLTPDTIPKLRRLPKFIFIIGGGPTGCENAEYFAKLGSKVIIMEQASRLLPKEDSEVGETIKNYFVNELGIMVLTNSKVVAVEKDGAAKRVIFKSGSQDKAVRVDCVALATGSTPCTYCGLENAGVRRNKRDAIIVNKLFQTTAKNIYAIGDCLGSKQSSTERANYEASILADNLVHHSKGFANYDGFIRTVDIYPAFAGIGKTEAYLTRHHAKYKKSIVYLKDLPISTIDGLDHGFVKIISSRRTGRILGASIVAPNAPLIAQELSLAIRHRLKVLEIASAPHVANSYNYAVKLAAKNLI